MEVEDIIQWATNISDEVSEGYTEGISEKDTVIATAIINAHDKHELLKVEEQARKDQAQAEAEAEAKAKYETERGMNINRIHQGR